MWMPRDTVSPANVTKQGFVSARSGSEMVRVGAKLFKNDLNQGTQD